MLFGRFSSIQRLINDATAPARVVALIRATITCCIPPKKNEAGACLKMFLSQKTG